MEPSYNKNKTKSTKSKSIEAVNKKNSFLDFLTLFLLGIKRNLYLEIFTLLSFFRRKSFGRHYSWR